MSFELKNTEQSVDMCVRDGMSGARPSDTATSLPNLLTLSSGNTQPEERREETTTIAARNTHVTNTDVNCGTKHNC